MKRTVKQLADVAGITPRTLHYYDQIGLLRPAVVGENGYRYYDDADALRLQQIMFFRELDFSLAEIQAIVDAPDFDLLAALESHKRTLQTRLGQLSELIHTIDRTVHHLKGETPVATHDLFAGFDAARQSEYEQEIAEKYGERELNESRQRWSSYSPQERARILREGETIYRDLAAYIGQAPSLPTVQQIVARWHQHIHYFYAPTPAILAGLAEGYASHPDFVAFYTRIHPEMPQFLRAAILHYCAHLPTAPERELPEQELNDELAAYLANQAKEN